ncbi:MAG TPA: GAF domain-containing protein, partial [Candidatus Acidoferrales bacterium]|nr:GAF domain-containing protein [Candidatus Acidoferrales bacterium]
FVISRAVVYAVVTSLLVVVIGLVDWATSAYLSQLRLALAIDAAVTIGLVLALHRISGIVENGVDFLIYREKHEAERYLKRLARTLLRARREETIDHALVQDPYDKLDLTLAALFRRVGGSFVVACAAGWRRSTVLDFEHEHDLIRFLSTERRLLDVKDLHRRVAAQFNEAGVGPAVAVPIFEGDELSGFAIYGLHRDGTKLDPDERELLEALCDSAAQAYVRVENLRLRALVESTVPLATQ